MLPGPLQTLPHRLYWSGLMPVLRRLPPSQAWELAWRLSRRARGPEALPVRQLPELDPRWTAEGVAHAAARARRRGQLELGLFPGLGPETLAQRVALEGLGELEALRSQGRGVILLAIHTGSHGLPPLVLSLLGYPVVVERFLLPRRRLPAASAWAQGQRRALEAALGLSYLDAGEEEASMARHLAQGGILVTSGDGWVPGALLGEWCWAELLGARLTWPLQGYRRAQDWGAPLMSMSLDSSAPRHRLSLRPLCSTDPLGSYLEHYREALQRSPGQWQFWGELSRLQVPPADALREP